MTWAPTAGELAVIGHTGGSGLANNATMFVKAFQAMGVGHRFFDSHRFQLIQAYQPHDAAALERDIALYTVNADEFAAAQAGFETQHGQGRAACPIGFFLWETTRPPRLHRLVQPLLREVWVPTEFVRRVYRDLFDDAIEVVNVGKCITLPPELELPSQPQPHPPPAAAEPFVFLNISDFDSSIRRKHPLPVVQAFLRAFRSDPDVRLVLKVRKIDLDHWSNAGRYWQQVVSAIGGDPRISILHGNLPQRDYWRLLQSAGCLVTLHRAEGFCYGAAHAMLLNVPVIATDFSGTQDFCTPDTAWPVAAELVPVQPGETRYHEDVGLWASPDIDHAAQQMRAVRQGGAAVLARTQRAQQLVAQQYSAERFQATLHGRLARG